MFWKKKQTKLSPSLDKIWGFLDIHHLILATPEFIVWIDKELDIDWKTSSAYDDSHTTTRQKRATILNRASQIESGEWYDNDPKKTLNLKRQIAEAIARSFDGDFENAEAMLAAAEEYRTSSLKRALRTQAIEGQIEIRNNWKKWHRLWTSFHYLIGGGALLFSTLVAAKLSVTGLGEGATNVFAWLVAFLTALLTFLTPDKKADKYIRAWSILNNQITRYNTDETYTVSDVLDACQRGESIILQTETSGRPRKA